MTRKMLQVHLAALPFIAIVRGIAPDEAVSYGTILCQAGFGVIETPLNSPEPYRSIEKMAVSCGDQALIGAGTVLSGDQVERVRDAGGRLIVSPHCDPKIIEKTKANGMVSIPGVATPTEIMTALRAGADALKLFPAEMIGLAGFKALKAVIPAEVPLIPVGGIDIDNWRPYIEAGAIACGLGSSLYRAGMTPGDFSERAQGFQRSWQESRFGPAGGRAGR